MKELLRKLKEETPSNLLSDHHRGIVVKFIVELQDVVQMRLRNDAGQSQQLKMLKDNIAFMVTDLKNKLGIS